MGPFIEHYDFDEKVYQVRHLPSGFRVGDLTQDYPKERAKKIIETLNSTEPSLWERYTEVKCILATIYFEEMAKDRGSRWIEVCIDVCCPAESYTNFLNDLTDHLAAVYPEYFATELGLDTTRYGGMMAVVSFKIGEGFIEMFASNAYATAYYEGSSSESSWKNFMQQCPEGLFASRLYHEKSPGIMQEYKNELESRRVNDYLINNPHNHI